MISLPRILSGAVMIGLLCALSRAATPPEFYRRWPHGISAEEQFFPIAVWLQSPAKAERYRAAGFNTFVALWRGPTEEQLSQLKRAGMRVICAQNEVGLRHRDDATIIGWMHGDEPDNAQSLGKGQGYGPPIAPEKIIADYENIQRNDPTRPVMLNLGQAVAWDDYIGRGVRRRHPEDYAEYVKGCDIASFDIYPVVSTDRAVSGHLELVAHGVERLRAWAGPDRAVWNCIECTHISNANAKATPEQVRSEVWMSIIHGSRGVIYFVHEWKPRFNESALLDDAEMLTAVTALNRQICGLAAVINSPAVHDAATVVCTPAEVPIATLLKRKDDAVYVFAVAMRDAAVTAEFAVPNLDGARAVEVLDENRTLHAEGGRFRDEFRPWGVHLYRIKG